MDKFNYPADNSNLLNANVKNLPQPWQNSPMENGHSFQNSSRFINSIRGNGDFQHKFGGGLPYSSFPWHNIVGYDQDLFNCSSLVNSRSMSVIQSSPFPTIGSFNRSQDMNLYRKNITPNLKSSQSNSLYENNNLCNNVKSYDAENTAAGFPFTTSQLSSNIPTYLSTPSNNCINSSSSVADAAFQTALSTRNYFNNYGECEVSTTSKIPLQPFSVAFQSRLSIADGDGPDSSSPSTTQNVGRNKPCIRYVGSANHRIRSSKMFIEHRLCSNCGTNETPLWRRNKARDIVCNACGLYFKTRKTDRPQTMRKDSYQRRKSKPKKDKGSHMSLE